MLRGFATWPDVVQYVRSGGSLYYVPSDSVGPCRTIAHVRSEALIWLRCPDYLLGFYPSIVADTTFLDKLYRWEARNRAPTE